MNKFSVIASVFLLCLLFNVVPSEAASMSGAVVNKTGQGIPGLTVSLAHPAVGRSYPCTTDELGRFVLNGIPPRPEPYYLEIYWGDQLVYRNVYRIPNEANVAIGNITLQ